MRDSSARRQQKATGTRAAETTPSRLRRVPSSSYHHGDLRSALIAEGRRVLEELGPNELSLRGIAKSVGVSIAAPAHHFEGKEGLLAAIAADGFRELARRRQIVASTPLDPMQKAFRMMACYVDFAVHQKGLFNLMVGPRIIARRTHAELISEAATSFDLFATSITECAHAHGWAREDFERLVHAAWAVEHGLAMLILANRVPLPKNDQTMHPMASFSISMLLKSIAAGPEKLAAITVARDGTALP